MIYRLNNVDGTEAGVKNIGLTVTGAVITNVIIWGKNIDGVTSDAIVEIGWSSSYDQVMQEFALAADNDVCHNWGSFEQMGVVAPALATIAMNVVTPAEANSYLFDIIVVAEGL